MESRTNIATEIAILKNYPDQTGMNI